MSDKIPLPDYAQQAAALWRDTFRAEMNNDDIGHTAAAALARNAVNHFSECFAQKLPVYTWTQQSGTTYYNTDESVVKSLGATARPFRLDPLDVESRKWLDPRDCEHFGSTGWKGVYMRCSMCGCAVSQAEQMDHPEGFPGVLNDRYPKEPR